MSYRTFDLTLNPAGEIGSTTRSNDSYAYTGHANANVSGTANGLNQLTAVGRVSNSHDSRGNISAIGSNSYGYSSENLLASGPSSTTLSYDPANRLYQTAGGAPTRFGYDGGNLIGEYNSSNALQRRYVFGPGTDEPLVQYEGSGTSTRRWFHADERGSVVAVSDASGDVVTAVNRYDEYGNVQGTLTGRFGYTGQAWLPEIGMAYYRARIYNPAMGRFMQTDPIGIDGGMNVYAYVGNNPVNFTDPLGLRWRHVCVDLYDEHGNPQGSQCGWKNDDAGDGPSLDYLLSLIRDDSPFSLVRTVNDGLDSGDPEQDSDRVECSPTEGEQANSGAVTFTGNQTVVAFFVGFSVTAGYFGTESGIEGNFFTGAAEVGFGLSNSNIVGESLNLGTFNGRNLNISGSLPNGISGHLSFSTDGRLVGWSGARGFSALSNLRRLGPIGGLGAHFSGSMSRTFLFNVTCPSK